jgi:hypothetical protein
MQGTWRVWRTLNAASPVRDACSYRKGNAVRVVRFLSGQCAERSLVVRGGESAAIQSPEGLTTTVVDRAGSGGGGRDRRISQSIPAVSVSSCGSRCAAVTTVVAKTAERSAERSLLIPLPDPISFS